jgi:hypothetical protein
MKLRGTDGLAMPKPEVTLSLLGSEHLHSLDVRNWLFDDKGGR